MPNLKVKSTLMPDLKIKSVSVPKFLREQANSFNVFNGGCLFIDLIFLQRNQQKAVADDVADDVADTSIKAAVVKVADVAAKIVHTSETLVTMTDKDLDVLVDKIVADVGVMDVVGMDVPKQDDVALNELHTPDRGQIPDAIDPGSVRSMRVVGEGRTDFNARSPSNKRYLSICSRYVGTLEYADAKFFATFTGEEAQLKSMHIDAYLIYLAKRIMHRGGSEYAITDSYFFTHVSELWENWNRNFYEIPQWSLTFRGSGQTRVLNGGKCAIFAGMRMLLPDILDEGEYFKHSGRKRRTEPFKAIQIPPKKVGKQEDGDSCGIWALHFAERLIAGQAIYQRIRQCHIPMLRWHFVCQFFANSEPIEEDF
ncbi:hypothetical protein Dimus_018838 [Dionaea muscipula]